MALGQHRPVASGVLDQPAACLHQPLLQTGQRPVLGFLRQHQPPPEVSQVVGDQAQRQPELGRRRQVDRKRAFRRSTPLALRKQRRTAGTSPSPPALILRRVQPVRACAEGNIAPRRILIELRAAIPDARPAVYALLPTRANVGSNVIYRGSAAVDGAAELIGSMIPPCIVYGPDLRATSRVCTTLREGKTRVPICNPRVPQVCRQQHHETPIRATRSPITPETLSQVSRRRVPTSTPGTCRSYNRRPG